MAKQKDPQTTTAAPDAAPAAPASSGSLKKYAFRIVLLAAVCSAGYGLWKNPQLVDRARNWLAPAEQEDPYAARFAEMQNRIARLQNQLDQTNYKIDNSGFAEVREQVRNLEKMNLNMIDSKADVATILGVITRMDAAEQKINNLSEVTDSSALLLTGVLLVKDAAGRGQTFEYEAEVLNQIAAGNPQASRQTEKLQAFAASGIPSDLELAVEFEQIRAAMLNRRKQDSDQTWKQRLNTKLNEIVQIKKLDADMPLLTAEQTLDNADRLIENDEILRAAALLKKSTEPEIADSAELRAWIAKVEHREEFYQAVSALSANALAALKVDNLRKVRGK